MKPRELPTLVTASAVTAAALTVGGVAVLFYLIRESWIDAAGVLAFFLSVSGAARWLLTRRDRRRAAADVGAWIREADGQPYDREALRIALEEPDAPDADRWRQDEAPPTAEAWVRFRALLDERLRRRL